ncbi:FG-GAP repeat domain-containing protein [Thalassoroseus pseudoceratinae]|uniref:FG-GAP repeat domain-containing protein n=1 Tax=Thalassoroseus pseudoceratinae TaxID=2713176 RepID=UPI00141DF9AB|nr:VCBS repeat-containing protein [Thalassoroseus pseudoceratinae]
MNIKLSIETVGVLLGLCAGLGAAELEERIDSNWRKVVLDKAFRSEGVAAADVNHDGQMDVLVGDLWYEAPDWKIHEIRKPGEFVAGVGYSGSFAMWAHDVNSDGWDDLIHVGFPGAPCHWYENPQNKLGHWKEHMIWTSACNETPLFTNLVGDDQPELIMGSQPESQMGYLPVPQQKFADRKWDFHAVSTKGTPGENGTHRYYHGLGTGDMNGDGRLDVIIAHGWWEQPADKDAVESWTFHPMTCREKAEGKPVVQRVANIFADDLDGDGDADLLMSSAHAFGVWWVENVTPQESENKVASEFLYHLIDKSYSQTHADAYVDLNGDGKKELVTGKRFYAHNGKDPGGKDPVGMYWYEIQKSDGEAPKFVRHEIEAGRGTGVGTQFTIADVNNDQRPDIVLSNKKGVHLLIQTGSTEKAEK